MNAKTVYNRTRLRNLKRAKLKQLECQLQLHKKNGADNKVIHQTMKDIQLVQSELANLK